MNRLTCAILISLMSFVAATAVVAQTTTPPLPKLGGYIQLRETAVERAGLSAALNRARFSIDGALPQHFSYRALVELEASAGVKNPAAVSLREATIKWSMPSYAFTAGQFKTPFSREYLIPVPALETADFSAVVDSLAPKYDVGVMGEYMFGPFATVTAGVFNGEGQNSIANRDSTVLAVGRLVVRPLAQLALGSSVTRTSSDSVRWGVEATAEYGGAMLRSEYITRHLQGRARNKDDYGWYVLGGFRVIPQVQLFGRLEDFQRPAIGIARRVRATTIGTTVEIVPNRVRLLVEGVRRATGAKQANADSFIAQVLVRF